MSLRVHHLKLYFFLYKINNTKKIKKWSKKARSSLSKLPVELFEKVVHGKK